MNTETGIGGIGHREKTQSVYVGYPDQKITLPRLNSLKDSGAVVLAVSYLGQMSRSEFKGDTSNDIQSVS